MFFKFIEKRLMNQPETVPAISQNLALAKFREIKRVCPSKIPVIVEFQNQNLSKKIIGMFFYKIFSFSRHKNFDSSGQNCRAHEIAF